MFLRRGAGEARAGARREGRTGASCLGGSRGGCADSAAQLPAGARCQPPRSPAATGRPRAPRTVRPAVGKGRQGGGVKGRRPRLRKLGHHCELGARLERVDHADDVLVLHGEAQPVTLSCPRTPPRACNDRRISISCLSALMSFSLLPCFIMNLMACEHVRESAGSRAAPPAPSPQAHHHLAGEAPPRFIHLSELALADQLDDCSRRGIARSAASAYKSGCTSWKRLRPTAQPQRRGRAGKAATGRGHEEKRWGVRSRSASHSNVATVSSAAPA